MISWRKIVAKPLISWHKELVLLFKFLVLPLVLCFSIPSYSFTYNHLGKRAQVSFCKQALHFLSLLDQARFNDKNLLADLITLLGYQKSKNTPEQDRDVQYLAMTILSRNASALTPSHQRLLAHFFKTGAPSQAARAAYVLTKIPITDERARADLISALGYKKGTSSGGHAIRTFAERLLLLQGSLTQGDIAALMKQVSGHGVSSSVRALRILSTQALTNEGHLLRIVDLLGYFNPQGTDRDNVRVRQGAEEVLRINRDRLPEAVVKSLAHIGLYHTDKDLALRALRIFN